MSCKLAISSMSLGRCFAGHDMTHKLDMAQKYGYLGIELFYEDLVDMAASHSSNSVPEATKPSLPSAAALLAAAQDVHQLCTERGLEICSLQPFAHYEGLLDRKEHERRVEELKLWFELAHELHTDLIAVPSNFLPASQVSEDMALIVSDLQKAADLAAAASPPIRLSYESLAWGTRFDTWEQSWEIVQSVDRHNFGLCLDTFNIAARIFADPASIGGVMPNAIMDTRCSMTRLLSRVDPEKIFLVQVVDGEKLRQPLVEGHAFYNNQQPARMSWSRNCRLFYSEKDHGAYLPVKEIALTIFQGLGWKGWVSMELFNRRMSEEDKAVPEELAQRGANSWRKLAKDVGWTAEELSPKGGDVDAEVETSEESSLES